MSRYFLPAVFTTLWMLPLAASGEDSTTGSPDEPAIPAIQPIPTTELQAAEVSLSDDSPVQPAVVKLTDPVAIRPASSRVPAGESSWDIALAPPPISGGGAVQKYRDRGESCENGGDHVCDWETGGCYGGWETEGCHGGCGRGGAGGQPCCCRMPQHHAYFPVLHGYYYFRPYHPSHIQLHQQRVAGWGEDPRNPYSNDIFRRVYADYWAERSSQNDH